MISMKAKWIRELKWRLDNILGLIRATFTLVEVRNGISRKEENKQRIKLVMGRLHNS